MHVSLLKFMLFMHTMAGFPNLIYGWRWGNTSLSFPQDLQMKILIKGKITKITFTCEMMFYIALLYILVLKDNYKVSVYKIWFGLSLHWHKIGIDYLTFRWHYRNKASLSSPRWLKKQNQNKTLQKQGGREVGRDEGTKK